MSTDQDILELFADAQTRSRYRTEYGELPALQYRPSRTKKRTPKEAWQCRETRCQRGATVGPRGGKALCDRCRAFRRAYNKTEKQREQRRKAVAKYRAANPGKHAAANAARYAAYYRANREAKLAYARARRARKAG